jgi:trk system potassium uptake protein TrkA
MRAVIVGLGLFGKPTAIELFQSGCEVIAIDTNSDDVDAISDHVSLALCADGTSLNVLRSHGIPEADVLVAAIVKNFEAQVLTVIRAKQVGIPKVVARAGTIDHEKVLLAVGADIVLRPEEDAAAHLVQRLTMPSIRDYFQLDDGFSLVEVDLPVSLVGKNIVELDLRKRYRINLVARRRHFKDSISGKQRHHFEPVINPTDLFEAGDQLSLLGSDIDIARWMSDSGVEMG